MVAEIMHVNVGSGTTALAFSGTQFQNQNSVSLTLLCALSGLAIIPVRCDSTGRIGSIV